MAYSNDPQPNPYAQIPNPLPVPNIDFPTPFWINKLKDLIIVGCLNPDLAYAALLVPAALKTLWTVETPSTKQIVHGGTGSSWICGTKQVLTGVQGGDELARSQTGRFLYGLAAGFDTMAYFAFMLSSGALGVIDYASYAAKFQRTCSGNNSQYMGITPVGGWPVPSDDWGPGPSYFNGAGDLIGPFLSIAPGQIGAFIASCSFSILGGTGGVIVQMGIMDTDTGDILDSDIVNNLFSVSEQAIVQFFTTNGRADRDMNLALVIKCTEAVNPRMVTASGMCYKRAWSPGLADTPPFYNARLNTFSNGQ